MFELSLDSPGSLQALLSCVFKVFLTFFGLAGIGLSCLTALFLYHVVFGVRYLGILNGVAAFVIIGIGKMLCSHYLKPLFYLTYRLNPK